MGQSAQDKLLEAIRRENWEEALLLLQRVSERSTRRGAFPYKRGETIYLRCPEWHYVGTVTRVDVDARWVELYPVVHILETDNARSFYLEGLRSSAEGGNDRYEVSPVPLTVQLEGWSATRYLHAVPEVDYLDEVKDLTKRRG